MNIKCPIIAVIALVSCNEVALFEDSTKTPQLDRLSIGLPNNGNGTDLQRFSWDTLENGIVLKKIDSLYILQDDMVFTEDGLSYLCPNRSAGRTGPSYYWPGGKVYYTYHSSLTPTDTLKCRTAMNNIMANTSIVFSPKNAGAANYVEFKSSSATQSFVGMQGGKQEIELKTSEVGYGNIMHEILHSLGFFHEHSRVDRDDYIIVYPANIVVEEEYNFQKYPTYWSGMDIGSLDFDSIMMYSSYAFSSNGQPTMRKTNGSTFFSQRYYLSDGDKEGIAAIYGPPFHRLESHYTVIEELLSGNTDKVVLSCTDSLIFYADKACTVRSSLQYPRGIRVKTTNTICGSSTNWNYNTSSWYWTVTIPSGTTAYCLSQWTNTEWYFNSNPYDYDVTYNEIVNYLVP